MVSRTVGLLDLLMVVVDRVERPILQNLWLILLAVLLHRHATIEEGCRHDRFCTPMLMDITLIAGVHQITIWCTEMVNLLMYGYFFSGTRHLSVPSAFLITSQ